MSLISDFMHLVDEGKKGNNIGLSTGLSKLDKIVYGVQRRNITLIGATSGGGKTTFALYSYVYQPLKQMLGDPRLKIIYVSLEIIKVSFYFIKNRLKCLIYNLYKCEYRKFVFKIL